MDKLIDCKAIADKIIQEVKVDVECIAKLTGNVPRLAVIMAGDNPASQVYVRNKIRRCEETGIESQLCTMGSKTETILWKIKELNSDPSVNGILVQLPLPDGVNQDAIIEAIDPLKDVDGLHPQNQARLLNNQQPRLEPCTPAGVIRILEETHGEGWLRGISATVLGRSRLFGQPMAQMLVNADATVHICHSKTENLDKRTAIWNSDVVISAIGSPKYFNAQDFGRWSTIIDVGINRDETGKLCGDVDTEDILQNEDRESIKITPVPGGVGIVTTAMLMKNTVQAYILQNNKG